MKKMPSITLKYGAAHNEVSVDDQVFDLNRLVSKDRNFLRKVVVGGLDKVGYFREAK